MEHFTSHHLCKYESILRQMETELQRQENLKKEVENETDKLIGIRIAMNEEFAQDNVFRVLVKVFDSLHEIRYLYNRDVSQEQYDAFHGYTNGSFYVVELYTSKVFLEKLSDKEKWLLSISVRDSKLHVCRNVHFDRKQFGDDGRICVVVPFGDSIEECTVVTAVYRNFSNFWTSFTVCKTKVDVSYHFAMNSRVSVDPLVALASNYNANLTGVLLKSSQVEYKFKCGCEFRHLFESLVKNCYHRLNSEVFSTEKVTMDFSLNRSRGRIKLENGVLVISCDPNVMVQVKNYFIDEIRCKKLPVEKSWSVSLANLRQCLAVEVAQTRTKLDDIQIIHDELRKLVYELVV